MATPSRSTAGFGRPRTSTSSSAATRTTSARVAAAAADFGAPLNVVEALRTLGADEIAFFGHPPMRVDFLRTVDGVSTENVLARAVRVTLDAIEVRVISLEDLLLNKRAAGRPRDLEDVGFLERLRNLPPISS